VLSRIGFRRPFGSIIGACILWGLDNNFTCNISAKDPLIIVTIKGLAAGSFSLVLAFVLKQQLPSFATILVVLGLFSYGLILYFLYLPCEGLV